MAFTNKMLQFFPGILTFHPRGLSKTTRGCVSVSFLFSAPMCSSAWASSIELEFGMRRGMSLSARDAGDPISLGTPIASALLSWELVFAAARTVVAIA